MMTRGQIAGLSLPVRFHGWIDQFSEVRRVGEWLIGYPRDRQIEERAIRESPAEVFKKLGYFIMTEIPGTGPQRFKGWFESVLQMHRRCVGSDPSMLAEFARQWLSSNGTFRGQDWLEPRSVLNAYGVPDDVKREIEKLKFSKIYVISATDFWLEWQLLEHLALLAGKVRDTKRPLLSRQDNEVDYSLWQGYRQVVDLDLAAVIYGKSILGADQFEQLGEEVESLGKAAQRGSKPKPIDGQVEWLLDFAFRRVLGRAEATIGFLEMNPGCFMSVSGVLQIAYICLLANSYEKWKRCQRPDCGKLFLASGRKTKYCTWYCGHIESVRRSRKPKSERRRKRGGKKRRR